MKSQKEWRQQALAARDGLTGAEIAEKSAAITAQFFQLERLVNCRTIMFYASFRSEVSTGAAIAQALARGMRVVLPLALPASHRLQPRLISAPSGQLRPGYCGIPEPDPERTTLVDPGEIEVVVVPGSVFDLHGGRVGYGGGYYDRFLQVEAPRATRIGICFAVQLQPEPLPLAGHDQRLDLLVTEAGVYEFAGRW